ncbi:Mediator of RNA polymerase II transcription subunit 12 [Bienertia sinuspersici]
MEATNRMLSTKGPNSTMEEGPFKVVHHEAMENNTLLVVRLEYKPKVTEEWTYFECFRLKDKL